MSAIMGMDVFFLIEAIAAAASLSETATRTISHPAFSKRCICETADVASYRNMVQIVHDRIAAMIDDGMSLREVLAARPTLDFDARYGSDDGEWTTEMFVTAVYQSLGEQQ